MHYPYTISLKKTVSLHKDGGDLLLAGSQATGLRFAQPGTALKSLLANLDSGLMTANQLCEASAREDNNADLARLYYTLARIEKKGFVCHTLMLNGKKLATLEPVSPVFRFDNFVIQGKYRLSRFACLRLVESETLLESPLGHAQVFIHEPSVATLIALLAEPHTVTELAKAMPEIDAATISAFICLLVNAKAVFPCNEDGRIAEDENVPLRQWEFHDLFFHSKSRLGRHENPLGGTYRFKDKLPHAPALKAPMSGERTALPRPAADSARPDFFAVLEARRSRRTRGETPITLPQLGEFLWRSARVQKHIPVDPQRLGSYESTLRPYPSGGATHELELYLTVARCFGLEPGLYHYDPLAHELERLSDLGKMQQSMLQDAMNASGLKQPPDVLFTLAARFGRVTWKYEGVAYALTQKHVGALYQQMYLVATALGLAPCALGAGNSDSFAEATGIDYFTETSVGDFMLSSAPL